MVSDQRLTGGSAGWGVCAQLKEEVARRKFKVVVCDESHYLKEARVRVNLNRLRPCVQPLCLNRPHARSG